MKRFMIVGALTLAALTGSVATAKSNQAAPDSLPSNQCFRTSDIENSVQVSETRLNILTRDRRYIRVETNGRCFYPPFIDPYVLRVEGSDLICSPIDMDLSAGPPGFRTPCIVSKLTQLTPSEVAAMPKKEKP